MGQALYRKYRPRRFSEAVGQEAITKTLAEAVKSGRISHAYLFAGPRGVGKTSVARILAHQVNQLNYEPDASHLDIIEIDAASNRRIDEIRDLREKVHITPTSAKYKVYIIDEVHMLTKEAFNALLKTLEEPPAHSVFILATTEAHKLPETIISRTQRFNFKPISQNDAKTRLQNIAKSEKIKIDPPALELLAEFGEGSLRDAVSLLDQLSTPGAAITEQAARNLLGIPSARAIGRLIESISNSNPSAALEILDDLKEKTASPANIAKALSRQLRRKLLTSKNHQSWITDLLKSLLNILSSSSPQDALELAVLEAAAASKNDGDIAEPPPDSDEMPKEYKPENPDDKMTFGGQPQAAEFSLSQWHAVLRRLKTEAPSLYSVLRLAEPDFSIERLDLAFQFSLHQKKAQEAKHLKLLAQLIEETSGAKLLIKCFVDKELSVRQKIPPSNNTDTGLDLKKISNIFGSAEVLES